VLGAVTHQCDTIYSGPKDWTPSGFNIVAFWSSGRPAALDAGLTIINFIIKFYIV
jgi:hypothetical protein